MSCLGVKKQSDLKMGMGNEIKVEPLIEEYFKEKVKNTKLLYGKYCAYDYESENNTRYELKSRRISSRTYESVFISKRKIIKGYLEGGKLILLFLFTDGLFFIQYDATIFQDFREANMTMWRDNREEEDIVIHIPVSLLTPIKF